ncbi:MAG: hypothetical protein A2Y78_02745 [Acidobacteria bacterium RBG_13_68_16]|nr:MAG: hypothetical protein A2Y78_02745 [Acidobacteria bacterium RBG_13_68_16]
MRARLAVLQFPLLYCFGVLLGLSIYGVDFGSVSGYLYVVPLLLAPLVLPRLGAGTLRWLRRHARPLAAIGVALGAVAYRPLHLGFWDEQSLVQSAAVSGLGLVSVVVGWLAVMQVANRPGQAPASLAGALAIVAVFFFLSRWYPLIPILGAVLCLAPAVTLRWDPEEAGVARRTERTPFLSALAFYLAAELGQVVWDLGVDSSWGPQLALAFVTAALVAMAWWLAGARVTANDPGHPWLVARAGVAALVPAAAVGVATAWQPSFVLHPLRQALLGLAFGGLIVAVFARMRVPGPHAVTVQGVWLWFTIGLAVSNVYSLQLEAYPAGRLAFAVPAIVAFLWGRGPAARRHRREVAEPT